MGLSVCNIITDLHEQELTTHGNTAFPIACYADDLCLMEVEWHWHDEWELIVVTEGVLHFDIENTHFVLPCGDGLFINSKVLHAVRCVPGSPGKLHSAVFHPRLIGGNMDSVFWQNLVQPFFTNASTRFLVLKQDISCQKDVLHCLLTAWTAISEEQDDFENLARYELSKAARKILQNNDFSQHNMSDQDLTNVSRIRTMMEYIDLHYMEDLTVDKIAASISASNSVCLRCFHEMLDTTPMKYVMDTRLRKAAGLLRTTQKSARDIALDCGFNDTSYFTKVFRLKYQCTPVNYRKSS
ncbi:MAG: AraC family transcriptional regulator [Eubacteriales bacterium]|nr:AraC family transcriptional regulator [Eubacteriales bacterium]